MTGSDVGSRVMVLGYTVRYDGKLWDSEAETIKCMRATMQEPAHFVQNDEGVHAALRKVMQEHWDRGNRFEKAVFWVTYPGGVGRSFEAYPTTEFKFTYHDFF